MYLVETTTLLVKAMRTAFDNDFPTADFRNTPIEIEYPVLSQQYPSIWADFQPVGTLSPVGIGQIESVAAQGGGVKLVHRWSFAGYATFTAVALTSLERSRLFDAMIAVVAFRDQNPAYGAFRTTIEQDPLIILQPNYHEIDQRGFSASPGTPWGTEEMMYEATIAIPVIGEFVSDPSTMTLVNVSTVGIINWVDDTQTDPTTGTGWIE